MGIAHQTIPNHKARLARGEWIELFIYIDKLLLAPGVSPVVSYSRPEHCLYLSTN